jgi:hypothetical protein
VITVYEQLGGNKPVELGGVSYTMWRGVGRGSGRNTDRWPRRLNLYDALDIFRPADIGVTFTRNRWVLASVLVPVDSQDSIKLGVVYGGGPYQITDFYWTSALDVRPCQTPWVKKSQKKFVDALMAQMPSDAVPIEVRKARPSVVKPTSTNATNANGDDLSSYTVPELRSLAGKLGVAKGRDIKTLNKAKLLEELSGKTFDVKSLSKEVCDQGVRAGSRKRIKTKRYAPEG